MGKTYRMHKGQRDNLQDLGLDAKVRGSKSYVCQFSVFIQDE
jgi:hypothetical protein